MKFFFKPKLLQPKRKKKSSIDAGRRASTTLNFRVCAWTESSSETLKNLPYYILIRKFGKRRIFLLKKKYTALPLC